MAAEANSIMPNGDMGAGIRSDNESLSGKSHGSNKHDESENEQAATEKPEEVVPYDFSDKIATVEQLKAIEMRYPLPPPQGAEWFNKFRYIYASGYRRLWAACIAVNVAAICSQIYYSVYHPKADRYGNVSIGVGANLLCAVLFRHEHFINVLFRIALSLPYTTPLRIRAFAAKVYCYGGVHSGCGVSAFLWYIFYTAEIGIHFTGTESQRIAMYCTTAFALFFLFVIIVLAHPYMRAMFHESFEYTHRYLAWAATACIWAQTIVMIVAQADHSHVNTGIGFVKTSTFWFLIVTTSLILHPWIVAKKRKVRAEVLSSHAVRLHFDDEKLEVCMGYKLTHNPFLQNHGFATLPNADGSKGFSIIVSNAGNWTRSLIENPPEKIWTRGSPTFIAPRVFSLFKPVIVVATGSGIGPCLSYIQLYPDYPKRVLWSARTPLQTYGPGIINAVLRSDPNALIIDTKKTGHPNMSALTYALVQEIKAEGIVIISNPKVTKKVVYDMEVRGVGAFGAIFDS